MYNTPYTMKSKAFVIACFMILLTAFSTHAAQISGTVTIDAAGTASTTVFKVYNSLMSSRNFNTICL